MAVLIARLSLFVTSPESEKYAGKCNQSGLDFIRGLFAFHFPDGPAHAEFIERHPEEKRVSEGGGQKMPIPSRGCHVLLTRYLSWTRSYLNTD